MINDAYLLILLQFLIFIDILIMELVFQVSFIYIIISKVERKLNYNSKLGFQFCAICPKLFILKEFYFLILESNMGPHHKYLSK